MHKIIIIFDALAAWKFDLMKSLKLKEIIICHSQGVCVCRNNKKMWLSFWDSEFSSTFDNLQSYWVSINVWSSLKFPFKHGRKYRNGSIDTGDTRVVQRDFFNFLPFKLKSTTLLSSTIISQLATVKLVSVLWKRITAEVFWDTGVYLHR